MTRKDICPKCWHEGCRGNCETLTDRRDRERREQVARAARQRRDDRKGGKR